MPASQPLFAEMRDWIREDLEASFRLLVSNGDLRRQHWRDELNLAIVVLGAFALISEPVGMLLFTAGVVGLGLDIEAYVNARSEAQRHEAFAAAIGDLLVMVFGVRRSAAECGPAPVGQLPRRGRDIQRPAFTSGAPAAQGLAEQGRSAVVQGHMAPMDEFGTPHVEREGVRHYSFRQEGEVHNNLIEQYSGHMAKVNDVFSIGRRRLAAIPEEELRAFLGHLFDSMAQLPASEAKVLWRGGRGPRVTIGARWRAGDIKAGTCWSAPISPPSPSPYIPRRFMLPKGSGRFAAGAGGGPFR